MTSGWTRAALVLASLVGGIGAAHADRIKNPTGVFSGLDKITGRIVSFEVAVGETVQFGALQMKADVCFTKPPTENPNTTSFVEVSETGVDGKSRRVFSGWLFAGSPGLHGIEHPVYDIWLVDCKGGTEVVPEPKDVAEEPPPLEADPRRPVDASRPGDIMSPPGAPAPVQAAPAPPPAGVAPAPRQQPVRRGPVSPPLVGNDRSNDR
ncbi:DUF2155 domain-containing protein [Microvirga rosea]|uniref:DUF2155 domain-containing protein n=1 Tax=Microvirga rosea TaxID=2715425 RepID=UPI001D0BB466|nr:DUF2155 domain-containing protein [Microvirga rosea]MCB8820621.1 DUF2155 domain-containing protein [Microvirga rosea]